MAQFKIIEMIGKYHMVMKGVPFSGGATGATNAIGWITTDTLIPTTPASLAPGKNSANNENFTSDWTLNSAMMPFTLPVVGAKVVSAKLHWMSFFVETEPEYGARFDAVTLKGPSGTVYDIYPDTLGGGYLDNRYDIRGWHICSAVADVTSIVNLEGEGEYTCGKVPSYLGSANSQALWNMYVVYSHSSFGYNSCHAWITDFALGAAESATLSGFQIPNPPNGRFYCSGSEYEGEAVTIRLNGQSIGGPIHTAGHFFRNKVCDYNDVLNTEGTYGNAFNGYGRVGTDMTTLDVSSALTVGTTNITMNVSDSSAGIIFFDSLGLQVRSLSANLNIIKYVDKTVASINDTITYTISIQNNGEIEAINPILIDTIASDIIFVENSVFKDGVLTSLPDPKNGWSMPNIQSGEITTYTFQAKILGLPAQNPIQNKSFINYSFYPFPADTVPISIESNTVNTQVIDIKLDVVKSSNKEKVKLQDTITYSFVVNNTGSTELSNMVLVDTLFNQITFINNSVKINNVVTVANLINGINLDTISAGEVVTISFDVKVIDDTLNTIPNTGDVYYKVDTLNGVLNSSKTSNEVNSKIIYDSITILKNVDKMYATNNDVLEYTFTIVNTGNVVLENLKIFDTIPVGTRFISNSVTINSSPVSGNIENGIALHSIDINEVITVSFKVIIV